MYVRKFTVPVTTDGSGDATAFTALEGNGHGAQING